MNDQTLPMKGEVFSPLCPSRDVLNHITSRWGVLILVALLEKTYRFSELRRKIEGVSEKMLAQNLANLAADGLVHREAYPVIPPQVEYSLTELGVEAATRMASLVDWLEENITPIIEAQKEAELAD
ncbi:MAG: winged helix-turn-helix transcriptional regulator [Pontibacterium sp.]